MNRLCITEQELSEYMCGCLRLDKRTRVEDHLAGCDICRRLLADAYIITNKKDIGHLIRCFISGPKGRLFFTLSFISLLGSFAFPRYFLQFLFISLISAVKWLLDSRTTKMMIMISDAWKNSGHNDHSHKPHNSSRND
ncbi:MAG: hypothetical protein ABIG55_05955 [Candidatus Omnitrophota bacterium]